jgi:hypothetical protein
MNSIPQYSTDRIVKTQGIIAIQIGFFWRRRGWDYNYNFYENDTEAAKSTEAAAKGKEAHPAPADMIHLSSFEVLILPLGMEQKMLFVIGGKRKEAT